MIQSPNRDVEERAVFAKLGADVERADTESSFSAERSNNTLRAYREIRRRILSGEMQPGDQFLEQELAQMLDMSRTPVREALIRLAEERLVEVKPRHGVRILQLTAAEIHQIYEVLTELKVFAAKRVAERGLSHPDRVAMADAITDMDQARALGDVRRWTDADRTFHDRLVVAAGNERLTELARNLTDQSQHARMLLVTALPPGPDISRGHSDLVDALVRQNADEAQSIKRRQMARSSQRIFDFMKLREDGAA